MRAIIPFIITVAIIVTSGALAAESNDKDVAELKQRIEVLEDQLRAVTLERDVLKMQLNEKSKGGAANKELAPHGSVWEGKLTVKHQGSTTTSNAKLKVTEREDKKVTLRCTIENGAIWDFECKFVNDSRRFNIVKSTRVRAADAKVNDANLRPAGGLKGKGTANAKKMTLAYEWKDAPDGPLSGDLEAAPVKE